MKTLRFMLFTVLTMLCGTAYATEVTWEASSSSSLPTAMGDDIGLAWSGASFSQGSQSKYNAASLSNNGTLTVTAGEGLVIQKVDFLFLGENLSLTTEPEGYTFNYGAGTGTWAGSANSVKFTVPTATTTPTTRKIKTIKVTYIAESSVPTTPVLSITSITNFNETYDLDNDTKTLVVYYKNDGTAAENAKLTLYVNGVENNVVNLNTIAQGADTWVNLAYNKETIAAGAQTVKVALTADDTDAVEVTKTVTFTKAAPEASFTVSAANVNVAYDATEYNVTATVTNTSETVDATGVQVLLQKSLQNVVDPQNIDLAAGESKNVTFTVPAPDGGFTPGTSTMFVMVRAYDKNKAQQEVTVTVEEAPVQEVKDLAITAINGTIDLGAETPQLQVLVQNNGTVDITDAPVVLKNGETTLGQGTISAKAGQQGWTYITINKTGLEAGTINVTATVTVEGDATPTDNTFTQEVTVVAAPVPTAAFTLTAENVQTQVGDATFEVKVTVKNIGDDAGAATVQILKGTDVLGEAKTTQSLEVNGEEVLTFTVNNPYTAAGSYDNIQAMTTDNKAGCHVTVTVAPAPVEQVVDINLTAIQGLTEINLKETNLVTVMFENNSTMDELTASVTLKMNDTEVGTKSIQKSSTFVTFTLPVVGLVAGTDVKLTATLNADGNKEGNTKVLEKTVSVVSGEAAPAPVITLNPVANQEVDAAGEQTISISVGVFNNGNADADEVVVKVYQSFGTDLATKTVKVEKDGGSAIASLSFQYDIQKATVFHVAAYINNVLATDVQDFTVAVKQEVADLTIGKIADIQATTEEQVKVTATVKNTSNVKAENVRVVLYQGTTQVDATKTINELEAGSETQVEFTIGQLAAGNYSYSMQIASADANVDNNMQTFYVKVTEPVVPVYNVGISALQGISNIDLAEGAENNLMVWYANEGNVEATGTVSLTLNGAAVGEAQAISVAAGKNGFVQFALPTTGLTAGEKATVVATVTVDGNTAEATTVTREYDIVNSSVATEATFAITADDVTVAYGETTFTLNASVSNTSTVDATDVKVYPFYNAAIEEEATTFNLKAGATKNVTFTLSVPENSAGKTLTYYVMAPKATAPVNVTFEAAPVEEKTEVALTTVQGISNIDLAEGAVNTITVWAENTGNKDVTATINVKIGETALEAQNVELKAGKNGGASFTLPTTGLTAGTKATVVATVTVEGNTAAAEATTITREYDVVNSDEATEATYSVKAANVEAFLGDAITVNVTVKNTSNIAASNVKVQLLKGMSEIDNTTIETLAAGAEETVSINIPAVGVSQIATTAGTYELQAVVDNKASDFFTVTLKEHVTEIVDLAVTSISGTLSLDQEKNFITVYVENKGTVDVENARVALTAGNAALGEKTVSVKAGKFAMCTIEVPATALTEGEFEVIATVTAKYDNDQTNNSLSKTYTIAAPVAVLTATAKAVKEDTGVKVTVTVTNSSNFAANDVVVTLYEDGQVIEGAQKTIETIAANGDATAEFTLDESFAGKQIQYFVKGAGEAKWLTLPTTTGISDVRSKMEDVRDAQIYTVKGEKVSTVSKAGLYIINGRKVVVK